MKQKLNVPYLFLSSSVLTINFLFFPPPPLLNFPPAENGFAPSSPSPRQQNVALGIKLFDYSVSHRLANLKLSHHAPWTHLWYVCLHIRACAACVGVCAPLTAPPGCVCVRAHREWVNVSRQSRSPLATAAFHACVLCVCACVWVFFRESHHLLWVFSLALSWPSRARSAAFILLSQHERELILQWFPDLLDYQTSNRKKNRELGRWTPDKV